MYTTGGDQYLFVHVIIKHFCSLYPSLLGHCTLIGTETGKCIGYAVWSKQCSVCDKAREKNVRTKVHDCCRNWNGSSKAMEPDMVVQIVKEISEKGISVGTISRLQKEVSPSIEKRSDTNHMKKIIGNSLYTLQKKHKQLSIKVIKHI